MLLLKACPKCSGDMHLGEDLYGSYASCLNCGYLKDVEDRDDVQKRLKVEAALLRERVQKKAA